MGIDYKETEEFYKGLNKLGDALLAFDKEFLERRVTEILIDTRKNTPVDTGRLKASWKATPATRVGNSVEATILNNARDPRNNEDYASHIEYGHRIVWGGATLGYRPGRFMMTRSIAIVEKTLEKKYNEEFEQFLKSAGVKVD